MPPKWLTSILDKGSNRLLAMVLACSIRLTFSISHSTRQLNAKGRRNLPRRAQMAIQAAAVARLY